MPWLVTALVLALAGVALAPPRGLPTNAHQPGAVGVLALDASQPPEEVWRVSVGGWQGSMTPLTIVDEVAVITTGEEAIGLSVHSGETLWSVPLGAATCTVHEALTCVERASGTSSSILRIDVATGEEHRLDLPRTIAAIDAGSDMVALAQLDGEWMLQRVTSGGELRWAVSMKDLAVAPSGIQIGGTVLTALGNKIYATFQGTALVVEARSGAPLDEPASAVIPTAYGYVRLSAPDGPTTLLDRDGTVLQENFVVAPDDDPASPDVLVRNDTSIAIERGGEVVWQTDPNDWVMARVDGALVTAREGSGGDTTVSGYDVATGNQLWSSTGSVGARLAAGSVVLFSGAGETLTAVEARTGETLWSIGTQPILDYGATADGIIVHLGSELVRLSWPR